MNLLCALFVCVTIGTLACQAAVISDPHPVIIFPGLSASALEDTSTEERVWVKGVLDKTYLKNLPTYWDSSVNTLNSTLPDIAPYPGLSGVRYLSGDLDPLFYEFAELISALEIEGASVDAAPYDWRLMPQGLQLNAWVTKTKSQIVDLFNHRGRKVVIVAHSLGNLMANYFLNQDTAFNEMYIESYIATSPPWAGAGLGIQAVVSGIELYHFIDWTITVPYTLLEGFACFAWVFPQTRAFGLPVVQHLQTTYTADEIGTFLESYDPTSTTLEIMAGITNLYNPVYFTTQPNVPIILITSYYQPTSVGVNFTGSAWEPILETHSYPDPDPTHIGDGTVPYRSLHANDFWTYEKQFVVKDTSHSHIIKSIDFIYHVITNIGTVLPI